MTVKELLDELLTKDKYEINLGIFSLLVNNKLDFTNLIDLYVEYLKCKDKANKEALSEASCCILQSFDTKKTTNKKSEKEYSHTQRCLYFLNKYKFFKCDELNKTYKYDENSEKEFLKIVYDYYGEN